MFKKREQFQAVRAEPFDNAQGRLRAAKSKHQTRVFDFAHRVRYAQTERSCVTFLWNSTLGIPMPLSSEFVSLLLERLAPLGHVRARRMFGGHGIYLEDVFFAIIIDDVLHLKVDDGNREAFTTRGIQPFHYQVKSKDIVISYYPIAEDVFDDSQELLVWARRAVEAALRARAAKPVRKKSTTGLT